MIITLTDHPPCFSLVSMPRSMQTEKRENTAERIFYSRKQTETFKGVV